MADDVVVIEEPVQETVESSEPVETSEVSASKDAEVDKTLELIYAEAEKKGVHPDSFSEDELKNILTPAESEKSSVTDTVVEKTIPVAAVKEPGKPEPPVIPPSEDWKQRYENINSLKMRQDGELGLLRQTVNTNKEFIDALKDTGFRTHVLSYFDETKQAQPEKVQPQLDPDDPDYVSKLVEHKVNTIIEERERKAAAQRMQVAQQSDINSFFAGLREGTTAYVSTGRDANVVTKNIATFIDRFKRGQDIPAMAEIIANYEQTIVAARKQGADEAIQKLKQDTIGMPKRTTTVSSKGKESASHPRSVNDIETREDLVKLMETIDPSSSDYDKGLELALKRHW